MANTTQTWTVTPAQYALLEKQVNAAGVAISGDSGQVSKAGATVGWTYDGTTLSISVLHALPFTSGVVANQIKAAVDKALENV